MGQSRKQLIQLAMIALLFTAGCAWFAPLPQNATVWSLRLLPALPSLWLIWLLVKESRRPDTLPDLLHANVGAYFERNGICFAPVIETAHGVCVLAFYFQNRFSRAAKARIAMRPIRSLLRIRSTTLPAISVSIECPGGAFGLVRIPFSIPIAHQGKPHTFHIAAENTYFLDHGVRLRRSRGQAVGPICDLRLWHRVAEAIFGLVLFGLSRTMSPARVRLTLPCDVVETAPEGEPHLQILWEPDAPGTESARPAVKAAA